MSSIYANITTIGGRKPSKKLQSLARRYHEGAVALLTERGLTPTHVSDLMPSTEFEVSTDAGSAFVAVHDDWTHIRFKDPKFANTKVACNPHSGKWNHHAHFSIFPDRQCKQVVDDALFMLKAALEQVNVRP